MLYQLVILRLVVAVQGTGDEAVQLGRSLGQTLGAEVHAGGEALDDSAAQALRVKLGVDRVIVVEPSAQGKTQWLINVRAVDEHGVSKRSGEAAAATLVSDVLKLVLDLPPLAKKEEAPPPAEIETPKDALMPATKLKFKRRHPYAMLVAGAVAFFLPYFGTIGLAAHYESYNANAARLGYAPVVGPLLARNAISDKDLRDGYDAGLLADGVVQIITFNVLLAGIVWCAVGEKTAPKPRSASLQPLFATDGRGVHLGAKVNW